MKINLNNKKNIYISFGLVILLILLIVVFTLIQTSRLANNIKHIVHIQNEKTHLISNMIYHAKHRTILLYAMALSDDPFIRDDFYISMREQGAQFLIKRERFISLSLDDTEKDLIQKQSEFSKIVGVKHNQAAQLLKEDKEIKARKIIAEVIADQEHAINILNELSHYQHNRNHLTEQTSIDNINISYAIGLVLTAIIIFTIIVIAGFVFNNTQSSIAALRKSYKKVLYSKLRERTIRDVMLDSVVIIDNKGIIQDFNKAAEEKFGYTNDEVIGQNISILMPKSDEENHDQYMKNYNQTGKERIIGFGRELIAKHKDGSTFYVNIAVNKFEFEGDTFFVGTMHDISKRKEHEVQLQHAHDELEARVKKRTEELANANELLSQQANFDALTGLANRYLFFDRLRQAIAQAKRHDYKLAILFIDLDGFKNINDSYGHNTGDKVLKKIAIRMQQCLRDEDTVARIGGDEFAIILNEVNEISTIRMVTEKILNTINQPLNLTDDNAPIGASIGISVYPDNNSSCKELLKQADIAMYISKDKGKNTFTLYENTNP